MKTILTLAAAFVFSFAMTESAEAKGSKSSGQGSKSSGGQISKSSGPQTSKSTNGGKTASSHHKYHNTKNHGTQFHNKFHGKFHGHNCLLRDYRGWSRCCCLC